MPKSEKIIEIFRPKLSRYDHINTISKYFNIYSCVLFFTKRHRLIFPFHTLTVPYFYTISDSRGYARQSISASFE